MLSVQFLTLWNWLPARLSLSQPLLVFTTEQHGFRLQTLLEKIDEVEHSILIIKATNGEVRETYLGREDSRPFCRSSVPSVLVCGLNGIIRLISVSVNRFYSNFFLSRRSMPGLASKSPRPKLINVSPKWKENCFFSSVTRSSSSVEGNEQRSWKHCCTSSVLAMVMVFVSIHRCAKVEQRIVKHSTMNRCAHYRIFPYQFSKWLLLIFHLPSPSSMCVFSSSV